MAQYSVECPACSTTYTVRLFGPNRDRQYKLDNWDWTCDDCREKQFAEKRRRENETAASANADAGLPALVGSEKQIAWAESIRSEIFKGMKIPTREEFDARVKALTAAGKYELALDEARRAGFDDALHAFECQVAGCDRIRAETSAHWWIENRDRRWSVLAMESARKIAQESGVKDDTTEAAAAAAEATVRPESPLTETVAEIRVMESSVEVVFPEKREDFWQIVKKQLGYTWADSCWRRKLSATEGTPADRAAEAGNRLLGAGFAVRIFDEAVRANAIAGRFLPECTRWVMKRTSGEYSGWFAITWKEDSHALYQAARKLPGSKWSKPSVVVPPEQFEQVLDFAELYEFNLSDAAQEIEAEARRVRDAALTAQPVRVEADEKPQPGARPKKLAVPEAVEVADEFKD
jgi:hypothetical protein